MEEFYNIFGPELKAVTGDPKRIEDVLKRVDALIVPIESVSMGTTYLTSCNKLLVYGNYAACNAALSQ